MVGFRKKSSEDDVSASRSGQQFRRNQTLVQRRAVIEDPQSRRHVHSLTSRRRKVGGVFLIALAVVTLLAILLTQFTARVTFANNSTDLTQSLSEHSAEYEESVAAYFGIHPAQRLRFLLDQKALSDFVGALHPEVSSLTLAGTQRPVETQLIMTLREPVAGWQIGNAQRYVDEKGVVFERNYYARPSVQIIDESGISPEDGTTVASLRLLGFVGQVVSLSESRGYTAEKVTLPADTTRRLDVTFKNVKPAVRFTIDRGAGEQVSEMAPALQNLSSRGLSPRYVDVRVEGRVVYR